ncbi:hypothetical protein IWW38_005164 [Coemansia aciculifera]|uniref:Uncharacterized protein n=1 Tax=Coemansia aciculifera TaxID=417176 RepID=A0ACC1LWK8_9FUNG|nr:hypothetical protein IWW38_005164 [Coemansia aciculifera]
MITNGAAYVAFVVVAVVLICMGAWLRRRRIQALIAQRQLHLEQQQQLESGLGNGVGTNGYSWSNEGTAGALRPPMHAHLRQTHAHSPAAAAAVDAKPSNDFLPPYSMPMPSNQPPPYAPPTAADAPSSSTSMPTVTPLPPPVSQGNRN